MTQPTQQPSPGEAEQAAEYITQLASDRWLDRVSAEQALRGMRAAAVPALTGALSTGPDQVRWGAARVLGDIADPASGAALVTALEDSAGGVRWLAAKGLIAIGPAAILPLLRQLLTRADSPWLQEGAHHVLMGLATPTLSPVIRALEERFPALAVPVAASEVLKELDRAENG